MKLYYLHILLQNISFSMHLIEVVGQVKSRVVIPGIRIQLCSLPVLTFKLLFQKFTLSFGMIFAMGTICC